RASDTRIARNREQIAGRESAIERDRRRCRDLEEEIGRLRRQLAAMGVRADDVLEQLRNIATNLVAAQESHRTTAQRLADEERAPPRLAAQADERRAETDRRRVAHLDEVRAAAALASKTSALESTVSAAQASCDRGEQRLAETAAARDVLAREVESLGRQLAT